MTPASGPAAGRWRELLTARALPPEIRAAAQQDPYRHTPDRFKAPAQPDSTPSREAALDLLGPDGGSVLDVGCGGGAASLALLPVVQHVTGVDSAPEMLAAFGAECAERGLAHREVPGVWPAVAVAAGSADAVVCHHVGYNTAELAPFGFALHAAAGRGVVVELTAEHPTAWMDPLWWKFWELPRPEPATAADALAVFRESGLDPAVRYWERPARDPDPVREAELACRRLCLPADRVDEVAAALAELPPRPRRCVSMWWEVPGSDR